MSRPATVPSACAISWRDIICWLEVSAGTAEFQGAPNGKDPHVSDELMLLEQRIREKAYQLWEEAGRPEAREQHFWFLAEASIRDEEAKLDKALADSFPASDPPSATVTIRVS